MSHSTAAEKVLEVEPERSLSESPVLRFSERKRKRIISSSSDSSTSDSTTDIDNVSDQTISADEGG